MWGGDRVRVRVAATPLTFDHPGQWLLAAWARRDRHSCRVASTPLALYRVWEPPPIPASGSHSTTKSYTALYCTVLAHGGDDVQTLMLLTLT